MSSYFSFDEDYLHSYYMRQSVCSEFTSLINATLYSTNSFQDTVKLIAEGRHQPTYWMNDKVLQAFKGSLLKTHCLPISTSFDYSYNGSYKFTDLYNFRNRLVNPTLPETPYPVAVRYIDEDGYYYIERPPFEMNVDISVNTRSRLAGNVKIWMPWTLAIIHPSNPWGMKVYFSSKPLQDKDSRYIPSILPNTYSDGSICFGRSVSDHDVDSLGNAAGKIKEIYSTVFNEYMTGGWNIDLSPVITNLLPSNYQKGSMVDFYVHMTADDIRAKYPRIKHSSALKIVYGSSHNRLSVFKYMFYRLSMMSLEETLQFYDEILYQKDHNKYTTFDKLLQQTRHNQTGYQHLLNKISSTLEREYDHSIQSNVSFDILLTNYAETMEAHNYDIFSKEIYSTVTLNNFVLKYFTQSIIDITEKEFRETSGTSYDSRNRTIYILDCQNKTYEKFIVLNTARTDFYYDYVKEHYCVPWHASSEVFA